MHYRSDGVPWRERSSTTHMHTTKRWGALAFASLILSGGLFAAAGDPPVISVHDLENTFYWVGNIPQHSEDQFPVSNYPTSITATGVPPGVDFYAQTPSPTASYQAAAVFDWDAGGFAGGIYTVTITATNSAGSTTATFHWIIHPGISDYIRADRPAYSVGDTITLTATFTAPVVVTGTPYVPLWGTKQANYVSGSGTNHLKFQYTVAADDPGQSAVSVYDVKLGDGTIVSPDGVTAGDLTTTDTIAGRYPPFAIVAPPLTIANQTVNGTVGTSLTAQATPTGASQYYLFNPLPAGLSWNSTMGAITGTPTQAGTTTVYIKVTDASGNATYDKITFEITSATAPQPPPTISDQTIHGTVGVPLSAQIVATDFQNLILQGAMPLDLYFNSSTGAVGGTPTQAGTFPDKFVASNANGSASAIVTFEIAPAPPPPTPGKSDQTITFSSPTSGVVVGQSIALGATSSSGLPIAYSVVSGNATINGNTLLPLGTATLVVRASAPANDTYNAAATEVNFGNPQKGAQQIVEPITSADVPAEKPLTLAATTSAGLPITYTVVSGPAKVDGGTLTFTGTGTVTVRAAQGGNDAYGAASSDITLTAHPVARLVNISSRIRVPAGGDGGTVGFYVNGDTPKQILIRAAGESLAPFGVTDGVANPKLTLFDAKSAPIATNTGWADDAQIAAASHSVGAFALLPGKSDAALLVTLAPGLYTAQAVAPNAGSILLEVYDVASTAAVPTKQLINISTRAHVDASSQVFQGFVISGDQPKRVLVRAVGATLKAFGVNDGISDPALKLYSAGTVVAANDDWGAAGTASGSITLGSPQEIATAMSAAGAFALPTGSKDAVILATLPPGPYSAVVSGSDAQSGTVLLEVYEAP
jgi:hypothetical protein